MPHDRPHPARGLTLVETLLALLILLVTMLGVMATLHAGQTQISRGLHGQRALHVAGEMLEQILATPYNDAWDFDGFSQSQGDQTDAFDESLGDHYQVYSRSVTVEPHTMSVSEFGDPIPGMLITITVQDAANRQWQLVRFRPEPGP